MAPAAAAARTRITTRTRVRIHTRPPSMIPELSQAATTTIRMARSRIGGAMEATAAEDSDSGPGGFALQWLCWSCPSCPFLLSSPFSILVHAILFAVYMFSPVCGNPGELSVVLSMYSRYPIPSFHSPSYTIRLLSACVPPFPPCSCLLLAPRSSARGPLRLCDICYSYCIFSAVRIRSCVNCYPPCTRVRVYSHLPDPQTILSTSDSCGGFVSFTLSSASSADEPKLIAIAPCASLPLRTQAKASKI